MRASVTSSRGFISGPSHTASPSLTGTRGHKEPCCHTQAPHTLTQRTSLTQAHTGVPTQRCSFSHRHLETPATPEHIGSGTHLWGKAHGHTRLDNNTP